MGEPINYSFRHTNGMVNIVLASDRLIVNTQGVGLIDKLKTIDILVSQVNNFCLVPTIRAQNLISRTGAEGGNALYDTSYDAEFIFSYTENGKLKKKRVFVNSHDEAFQSLLDALVNLRPEASLLTLQPAEAQKQIGVMGAKTAVFIIVGLLVGVPVLIAIIFIMLQILK